MTARSYTVVVLPDDDADWDDVLAIEMLAHALLTVASCRVAVNMVRADPTPPWQAGKAETWRGGDRPEVWQQPPDDLPRPGHGGIQP